MFEDYVLESYQIYDDPDLIAIETSIEGELGNGKLARKEKRLLAAAKAGDRETAQKIKNEITEDAKKIQDAAKREKNIQLAKAAVGIAAKAVSIGAMIFSLINSGKESKEWNKITAAGNGATSQQVAYINSLRSRGDRVNRAATVVDIGANLINLL